MNFLKFGVAVVTLLVVGVVFHSCQNSGIEPPEKLVPQAHKADSEALLDVLEDPIQSIVLNDVLAKVLAKQQPETTGNRKAQKIVPFLPPSGLILFDPGVQASFHTIDEYGPKDFWIENPDTTISVHVNNASADAFHTYFDTGESHSGSDNRLVMNYNGRYTEFTLPPPLPPIVIKFIDTSDPRNAYVFNGRGAVSPDDGEGSDKSLHSHFSRTPSGQRSGFIKLK